MADYDLGTAHGKIVITYDDRGVDEAEKSLDGIKSKSRELLGQFAAMAKGWAQNAATIKQNADEIESHFAKASAGVGVLATAISALNKDVIGVGVGIKILKDAGEAFGNLPEGGEKLPGLVQRIIRVSAAVTLLHSSSKLLRFATRNIAFVSTLTSGFASAAGALHSFIAPLRFVANGVLGVLTILKGFQVVKKYAKYFLAFNSALAGVGYGVVALASVGKSVADLTGLIGLLPAGLFAAAYGFGFLKVATSGFGDALKAMGDPAKFAEALKKLAPSAQETAKAIQGLSKQWKEMQREVQQNLFAGLGPEIAKLGNNYIPLLRREWAEMATATNGAVKGIIGYLNSADGLNKSGSMLKSLTGLWENLLSTLPGIVRVLVTMGDVGARVLMNLTDGLGEKMDDFADKIDRLASNGKLEAWIMRAINAVGDFYLALKNIGQIVKIVMKGLGLQEATPFLQWLKEGTAKLKEFLQTAQGQSALATLGEMLKNAMDRAKQLGDAFMTYVLPAIQAALPFMQTIGQAVTDGLTNAMKILGPVFQVLFTILSALAPAMAPIVTTMVTIGATLMGLALAFKIAAGAAAIFRTGVMLINGISAVLGLIGRLTGQVKLFNAAAKLIKGAAIAGALYLVADGLNEVNLKAAGGDPTKLDQMSKSLYNYVEAAKMIASGDFDTIGQQISSQFDQMTQTWSDGKAPIQEWWESVQQATTDAKIAVGQFAIDLANSIGDAVSGWTGKVGDSFMNDFVNPIKDGFSNVVQGVSEWGQKVGQSFQDDFINPIKEAPGKIGAAIGDIGSKIGDKASELWTGFKQKAQQAFQPVKDFFSQTPFEMGYAIGSKIGEFLKWGQETFTQFGNGAKQKWAEFKTWVSTTATNVGEWFANLGPNLLLAAVTAWENFKQGSIQKWAEFTAWVGTVAASVGTWFVNLGTQLGQAASLAWEQFKIWSATKWGEFIAWVQGLPAQIGGALSDLGNQLGQAAQAAWDQFKQWATRKGDETAQEARNIPPKIGSALGDLVNQLATKAREAWEGFKSAAAAKAAEVIADARAIPGRIVAALGSVGTLLKAAGQSIIDGLLAGIRAGVQKVYDFVSGIGAGIQARKGPLPYDRRLLTPAGVAIIQGLIRGMKETLPDLWKFVNKVNGGLGNIGNVGTKLNINAAGSAPTVSSIVGAPTYAGTTRPSGGDGASSGDVYNIESITIDGKTIQTMQDVADFFDKVSTVARAGKAS